MNRENITIEDCIDMYEKKRNAVIINDGKIICFILEKNTPTDR